MLLYQLMQQQDLQQLHSLSFSGHAPPMPPLSAAQLPAGGGGGAQSQAAIAANPFLALQHAHAEAQKPRLAEKAVAVVGQEKT